MTQRWMKARKRSRPPRQPKVTLVFDKQPTGYLTISGLVCPRHASLIGKGPNAREPIYHCPDCQRLNAGLARAIEERRKEQ